ncbi:MAG: adaptor protein MecA, partial [Lachnospiraceae bacterium]|nr:adaptor protein MecA [Lachnospiraceae bacterium]
MIIEKISEMEIRTVISKRELKARGISCDTFEYDTEESRTLFSEVVSQAIYQTGFDPEDYPLVIEAVPLENGSMAVSVLKTDDPEELDARFSHFSPEVRMGNLDNADVEDESEADMPENGANFMDILREAAGMLFRENGNNDREQAREMRPVTAVQASSHAYRMKSLNDLIETAGRVQKGTSVPSTVWKGRDGSYLLTFGRGS